MSRIFLIGWQGDTIKKIIGLIIFSLLVLKVTVLDNPVLLLRMSEGFDKPSTPFHIIIERIYKLSINEKAYLKMAKYMSDLENKDFQATYLRIIGVVGYVESSIYLKNINLNEPTETRMKYSLISSMGLTGDMDFIPILENLLKKKNNANDMIPLPNIALSLYFITGRTDYYFINKSGHKQNVLLNNGLINARKVIKNSKERKRTYEEMLILDKIFRPYENLDEYPLLK